LVFLWVIIKSNRTWAISAECIRVQVFIPRVLPFSCFPSSSINFVDLAHIFICNLTCGFFSRNCSLCSIIKKWIPRFADLQLLSLSSSHSLSWQSLDIRWCCQVYWTYMSTIVLNF
jgi:hypothetical protein